MISITSETTTVVLASIKAPKYIIIIIIYI